MNFFSTKAALVLSLTCLLANSAYAQNLPIIQLKPLTNEIIPRLPIATQQVKPATNSNTTPATNSNTGTSNTGTNTGTRTTGQSGTATTNTSTSNTPPTNPINIDTAILPLIDAGSSETGTTTQQTQNTEQTQCITVQNAGKNLSPKILDNQIKLIIILTLGSIMGCGIMIFGLKSLGQGQLRRGQSKADRNLKTALKNKKGQDLINTYKNFADAIADFDSGKNAKQSIHKLNTISKDFELFAGKETRQANQHFMKLISNPASSPDEIMGARRSLTRSIKNDLGLK